MNISFIGMSGSGKTTWSKRLVNKGFSYFGCDDYIEQKLSHELKTLGFQGIQDVARWLGQPYESQHKTSSETYLRFEKEAMVYAMSSLSTNNLVIDTTGSSIYVGDEVMKQLQIHTTIVYIKVPEKMKKNMFKVYMTDPKPVIWGNIFTMNENESPKKALERCYGQLLEYRAAKYQHYAHITIDYEVLKNNMTVDQLITYIQNETLQSQ
ncbi:MAG: hypothetical protein Q7R95_04450 [bacterium]|nr:hypothetical protein [bacterium]